MKRIVHKTRDFKEAEEYDIMQHRMLTPEQRQRISYLLKIRVYGRKWHDIRKSRIFSIKRIQAEK